MIDELVEEIQKHLDCKYQNWFFGAGISYKSNIPLMVPLTNKIEKDLFEDNKLTYEAIKKTLLEEAHIEHFLSHIGDLLALLERTRNTSLTINDHNYNKASLIELYKEIISKIGDLVRFGYKDDGDIVGSIHSPLTEITYHQNFVKSLFNRRSNLENITKINFFTTNYDTLLEDALILEGKGVVDGFTGGAMGFWNPSEFDINVNNFNRYNLYKLHGSIDWYINPEKGLIRSRYGTKYMEDNTNLLIYPQATKYIETQKDPFAFLFSRFRKHLQVNSDNILSICGYSFGDDHINSEIEMALSEPNNNTTLIIFIKELDDQESNSFFLPDILESWLKNPIFNKRVFILTNRGIYNGNSKYIQASDKQDYNWWTFEGLTDFIS